MKRLFAAATIAALLLSFSGCLHQSGRQPAIDNWKVVSQITVTCENQGQVTRRVYTDQGKMRQILNALRELGQKFTPETDPEALPLRTYCLTLTHTDGTQRIYCTKGDRYIRRCREPWQQADPEKVSELNFLLQSLPGDENVDELYRYIPRHTITSNRTMQVSYCADSFH